MTDQDQAERQSEIWESLLCEVRAILSRFGTEEYRGHADYLVVDDNYGSPRIRAEVQNLRMFQPEIVAALRRLLSDLPTWEVVLAVDIPGKEDWPLMGLTIRKHEIIDGLRRDLFPPEFQNFRYPDSRPGTGYD